MKKKKNIHHNFNSNSFSVSHIHDFASHSSKHNADPYKLPVNKILPTPFHPHCIFLCFCKVVASDVKRNKQSLQCSVEKWCHKLSLQWKHSSGDKILVLIAFHPHIRDKVREEREREGVSLYCCGLIFVFTSKINATFKLYYEICWWISNWHYTSKPKIATKKLINYCSNLCYTDVLHFVQSLIQVMDAMAIYKVIMGINNVCSSS